LTEHQRQIQSEYQPRIGREPQVQSQRTAWLSEQEMSPPAPRWSYKNMTDLGKAGLVTLGALWPSSLSRPELSRLTWLRSGQHGYYRRRGSRFDNKIRRTTAEPCSPAVLNSW
jgi:hypothetical protein